MKYNFYLLTVVLFVVMLSACSAPTQREQPVGAVSSAVEGGTVAEKEKKKEAPTVDLPTATPPAEAYPVVDVTPFPTSVPKYEDEEAIAEVMNRLQLSYDDAKYYLMVNNPIIMSGLPQALATRYPDSYAGTNMEDLGRNQKFVQLFSKDVSEQEVLKEARKYVKEEWMKHIKIRKVKYSLKELNRIRDEITTTLLSSPLVVSDGIMMKTNSVEIGVTDVEQFKMWLTENDMVLPDGVTLAESLPFTRY